ncbi:MAG: hypothetical protein F6K50_47900, partial [Moorea sp. SIO3I7]|nr:hypothetical protein [Moorena sp. SIO3I7]
DQLPPVNQKLLDAVAHGGNPQDRAASLQESLKIALSIDHNPVLPKKNLGH